MWDTSPPWPDVGDLGSWVRLPWLAHDEAPGPYITIPQYQFNKTKQHTPVAWLCWPSSATPSFDASVLLHCLSPSLDCFCQKFPKVPVDMTTNPTCCPLLAIFVRIPLCLRSSVLNLDSVSCAWLVTITLEAALHQVLRVLSEDFIQSFHTLTERSKLFILWSHCLLSADGSLNLCQSTSSNYCCISCRCFCDSPCTTRINTWTLCSLFDFAHILIASDITTNAFYLWFYWILGKSGILSYPPCLRAGILFRMAASPAHISSHVVWSRPHTSESVSRRDPLIQKVLSILILHSLMDSGI